MHPSTVDAFQYRCYRIAVYDNIPRSNEQYSPDYRRASRTCDQFSVPYTGCRTTMAIDERRVKHFLNKEKRSAERAVDAAKSDIKRTVNDVKNAFRPPWYKRIWSGFYAHQHCDLLHHAMALHDSAIKSNSFSTFLLILFNISWYKVTNDVKGRLIRSHNTARKCLL